MEDWAGLLCVSMVNDICAVCRVLFCCCRLLLFIIGRLCYATAVFFFIFDNALSSPLLLSSSPVLSFLLLICIYCPLENNSGQNINLSTCKVSRQCECAT